MANFLAPKGFIPSRHVSGGTPGRMDDFLIPSGHAENIYTGDAVKSDGAGGIALATAADAILGIFQGVEYVDPNGEVRIQSYWTSGQTILAGTVALAHVMNDPDALFKVQTIGSLDAAEVGLLVNLDTSNAGSSTYGQSGMAVTGATGAENQWRVMRILETPERDSNGIIENTTGGTNAWVEVMCANHEYRRAAVAASSLEQ